MEGCLYSFLVFLCVFLGFMLSVLIIAQKPTAMDVYQGNTQLEYRVVNGEKIDSTVIWKNKY